MDIKHNFADKFNRRLSRNAIARAERNPLDRAAFVTAKNSSYDFRAMMQLRLWREGHPVHNDIDNECCPDWSCCRGKQYMASEELREMFVRDPQSRAPMLQRFIAELPDEFRIGCNLPGQHVFRLERPR